MLSAFCVFIIKIAVDLNLISRQTHFKLIQNIVPLSKQHNLDLLARGRGVLKVHQRLHPSIRTLIRGRGAQS